MHTNSLELSIMHVIYLINVYAKHAELKVTSRRSLPSASLRKLFILHTFTCGANDRGISNLPTITRTMPIPMR